jgi:hypothetical protein
MAGSISGFLSDDHRRLDGLLERSLTTPDGIDRTLYDQFRAGLLRHIGMEEKILLPALQRLGGGAVFPQAAKLRLDHGALAALLMPNPTPEIVTTLRNILSLHNCLEEGPDGLYETSDRLGAFEVDSLIGRLCAAPKVAVTPPSDSPAVWKNLRGALERAGYRLGDDEGVVEKQKG